AVTLVLSIAVLAQAETASASTPVWTGVWQGTLGKYPVTACLQQDGGGEYFGAYYYEKRMRIIALRLAQEASATQTLHFVESEAMPKRAKAAKSAKASSAASAPPDVFA